MDKSTTLDDLGRGQHLGHGQDEGHMADQNGQPKYGMPTAKRMILTTVKFPGKETYKGLGSGFREWGERFLRVIHQAQVRCGFWWNEDLKIDCLSQYLDGKALSYFNVQYMAWWDQVPTLLHAMDNMYLAFSVQLTM
jgi:hypothetical protein